MVVFLGLSPAVFSTHMCVCHADLGTASRFGVLGASTASIGGTFIVGDAGSSPSAFIFIFYFFIFQGKGPSAFTSSVRKFSDVCLPEKNFLGASLVES